MVDVLKDAHLLVDDQRRRQTHRKLVELAIGNEVMRPGTTIDRAADTFFMLVNSCNYDLARSALDWRETDWKQWLLDTLTHEFLGHDSQG